MIEAPTPRIVYTAKEADRLCEELLAQPLVATDSEWYHNDLKRHPCNNGLTSCWTFCYRDEHGDLQLIYMHNFGEESRGNVHRLKEYWTSEDCYKILHNAPVDYHMLGNHGIEGVNFRLDTMLMDYLLDENRENRHGLKFCAEDFLGHVRSSYKETFGTPRLKKNGEPYASGELEVENMEVIASDPNLFEVLVDYASDDALDTWLLYEHYKKKMQVIPWKKGKTYFDLFWEVKSVVTEIIMRMERRGMPLDLPFLLEMKDVASKHLEWLEARIVQFADIPINPGSPPQKAAFLHGPDKDIMKGKRLLYTIKGQGLPIQEYTPTGRPKVGSAEMKTLKHMCTLEGRDELAECLGWMVDYSGTKTQLGTFFKGLAAKQFKGRIHTRINQVGTTSGRYSSSGPNLQNITTGKKDRFGLRDCFIAPPGECLIVADYGQLEYRILAHFSQDPKLIQAFTEGLDLHSMTTYNVFDEVKDAVNSQYGAENFHAALKGDPNYIADNFEYRRKDAKTLNFEIIYGVGPRKLSEQLGITKDEAWEMIQGWFRGYSYVKPWMNGVIEQAASKGVIKSITGVHRRSTWRINSRDRRVRGAEERTLVNSKIQGSAAAICERAMIIIDSHRELRRMGVKMIMQVHDELVLTCPIPVYREAAPLVKSLMEHPFTSELRVPLPVSVGVGATWATAKV